MVIIELIEVYPDSGVRASLWCTCITKSPRVWYLIGFHFTDGIDNLILLNDNVAVAARDTWMELDRDSSLYGILQNDNVLDTELSLMLGR